MYVCSRVNFREHTYMWRSCGIGLSGRIRPEILLRKMARLTKSHSNLIAPRDRRAQDEASVLLRRLFHHRLVLPRAQDLAPRFRSDPDNAITRFATNGCYMCE